MALVATGRKEGHELRVGDWVSFRNGAWEPITALEKIPATYQMFVWLRGYSEPFAFGQYARTDVAREEMD